MADPNPFKDKVILVTGAAQGFGEAIAEYVAARGASLSLVDLQGDKLAATALRISKAHPDIKVLTAALDITDEKAVEEWVMASKEKLGKISGCVNNAGIIDPDTTPLTEMSLETWNKVINVNLTGLFLCLKYQLRALEDGGSIVNMSSVAGMCGMAFHPAYSSSKHGLVGLSKTAAAQHAHRGVRVNIVSPSIGDTPMWHNLREQMGGNLDVKDFPQQLFQRYIKPEELAATVAFLLGDESKFFTQAIIPVDGGFTG